MTRIEYRSCRRMLRDNGRSALRWMGSSHAQTMDQLLAIADSKDRLQERADIVAYCHREGLSCNVRQTA